MHRRPQLGPPGGLHIPLVIIEALGPQERDELTLTRITLGSTGLGGEFVRLDEEELVAEVLPALGG